MLLPVRLVDTITLFLSLTSFSIILLTLALQQTSLLLGLNFPFFKQFFLCPSQHNLTLVDFDKQSFQLLPDNVRVIDPSCMKVNPPNDAGHYDSYNLIFLLVNDKLLLAIIHI
jgi:hypothetical protein